MILQQSSASTYVAVELADAALRMARLHSKVGLDNSNY